MLYTCGYVSLCHTCDEPTSHSHLTNSHTPCATVVDVVKSRLEDRIEDIHDHVVVIECMKQLISAFMQAVHKLFMTLDPSNYESIAGLQTQKLIVLHSYFARIEVHRKATLRERGEEKGEDPITGIPMWLQWLDRPTIGWLQSGCFMNSPPLRSTYSNSDEYADTLTRIWTLLSFYWVREGITLPHSHLSFEKSKAHKLQNMCILIGCRCCMAKVYDQETWWWRPR